MIARYIEEHSDQVAFMTAFKLGQTVGVSESTVVRFATEIGYSGYPALQQAMQEMIRSKMTSVQRLERTSRTIPMDRLLDEVLDQDIDILKRTKENLDREAFYRAADALVNARLCMCWERAAAWPWPPLWPTICAWCLTRSIWWRPPARPPFCSRWSMWERVTR